MPAQRGEEPGSDLYADRVDEQDQPRFARVFECFGFERDAGAGEEVSGRESGEQNPRNAQPDAKNVDASQRQAGGDDQAQDDRGLRNRGSAE